MKRILVAGIMLLAAVTLVLTNVHAQGKSEVKVTAVAGKPDASGKQVVTITLDINKPWYAYANEVGLEDLAPVATKVAITGKSKLDDLKIDYPTGKLKKDALVGDYRVYEEKAEIKATIRRAKGDDGPLSITVNFSTCHPKGVCLPPETVKLTVP